MNENKKYELPVEKVYEIIKFPKGHGNHMRTSHRTWLKIICNPVLRLFGFQIVSCFDGDNFLRYEMRKTNE